MWPRFPYLQTSHSDKSLSKLESASSSDFLKRTLHGPRKDCCTFSGIQLAALQAEEKYVLKKT
jgi:hypothetical protein